MITVLSRRGTLWRKVQASPSALGASDQIIFPVIPFEVIPVSQLDRQIPFALEATHILWLPRWATANKEDWVAYATYQNVVGSQLPYRFVINSRQQNVRGFPNTGYFCTERE